MTTRQLFPPPFPSVNSLECNSDGIGDENQMHPLLPQPQFQFTWTRVVDSAQFNLKRSVLIASVALYVVL